MATYLPNVSDFIPQIQPFRPDFNFYAGALQMKQGQYDQAHKQISQMYGSLLNAPMMREANLEARNDYFKTIEGEIKKISNLDLSKQANVDSAVNLFSGLYENQNIVKDMMWTKSYQQQVKRGEGFRNCVDPAKCGGAFWQGGLDALEYKAQEFRAATDEQALGFGNVNYTPYQNVMEKAIKLAKDADLNITVDEIQNGYIVTTKNGPNLIKPLNALFTGVLANDPGVMEYYKTKAYVDRKGWVNSNVGVYGSQENAEMAYIEQVSGGLNKMLTEAKGEVDSHVDAIQGQKKILEQRIRTEGANPNGTLAEQYRALNNLEGTTLSSQESINAADKTYKNSVDPAMRNFMGENIDNAMASYFLAGDIGNAAQTLAFKNYEQTLEADPYALEQVRHTNRMLLEQTRAGNNKKLQDEKLDKEKLDALALTRGPAEANMPRLTKVAKGATYVNLDPDAEYSEFKEQRGDLINDVSANEKTLLTEIMTTTREQSKNENGSGLASLDLINFGDALFTALVDDNKDMYSTTREEYITQSQNSKYYQDEKARWDIMSPTEKVKYAQNKDFTKIINNGQISGTILDSIYEEVVSPMVTYDSVSNQINKDYLQPLWETSGNARNLISTKKALLTDIGEYYSSEVGNVISAMQADSDFSAYAPMFKLLFDPTTGTKRSIGDFVKDYVKYEMETNGSSKEEAFAVAQGLYSGTKFVVPQSAVINEIVENNSTAWGIAKNIWNLSTTTVNDMVESISLDEIWGRAFSKFARPKGQGIALGLLGSGSDATMALSFDQVDPAEFTSEGTMNTISFMKDALSAGEGEVLYTIGMPGATLPEESSPTLQSFLSSLYQDMLKSKDFKDKARPILSTTYQRIAGSDENWSALNIKMPYEYMKNFVGTEDNKGPLFGQLQSLENGFTVYMNNDIATNGFYESTKSSDIEKAMFYTGKYDFDNYPAYTRNANLKQDSQGNYKFTGSLLEYDENGNEQWNAFEIPYTQIGTDLNWVVMDINEQLDYRINNPESGVKYSKAYWDSKNGTKDPAALLN